MNTRDEAHKAERAIDDSLGMFDLPDGRYFWSTVKCIDDNWVVVVDMAQEEE